MAVPEQTPYIEHTGNGATTSFALGFICDSKNDLIVMVGEIEPPVASWSLVGGNVVFTTAPAAGQKITLQRNTPFGRTTDYQSFNNSFRPQSVNGDFDRIWLKLQELGVADWLMKLYVDRLHREQKDYIDNKDQFVRQVIADLRNYVNQQDNQQNSYFEGLISQQGISLQQLDSYYKHLLQGITNIAAENGWLASFVVDASGKNQQEINNSFFNLGSTNVKDYGAKGDGITDDTLALMNACADFHTGVLYFPPGKYLISYDTINPHFSERIPAGITGSKVMRAICLFGLKNAVISGYGAEIFVRDQAKTILGYDSTFGILQSIGNIENVYIQGLTFNGNAFNQPYAGVGNLVTNNLIRNHGLSFFNDPAIPAEQRVFNGLYVRECVFKELGWHDDRGLDRDHGGDGILTFGIASIKNFYVEDNTFIDVGRWAVATDIYTNSQDFYENLQINRNKFRNEKNITHANYPNISRNLGFFDLECVVSVKTLSICNNHLSNGRFGIAITGANSGDLLDMNLYDVNICGNRFVSNEDVNKWYVLGFGTSVNSGYRNFHNFVFANNTVSIKKQTTMDIFLNTKVRYINLQFSGNDIQVAERNVYTAAILPKGKCIFLGNENNITHNNVTGLGFVSENPDSGWEGGCTINITHNVIDNAEYPFTLSANADETVTINCIANTSLPRCGWNRVSVPVNADGTSAKVVFQNIETKRNVVATSQHRYDGKVYVKTPRNQLYTYENITNDDTHFGYFESGDVVIDYPNPSAVGYHRQLVAVTEGYVKNVHLRKDFSWVSGKSIATLNTGFGSVTCWYGDNVYVALNTGTTGETPPTHTSGDVTDGEIVWRYVGKLARLQRVNRIQLTESTTYDWPTLTSGATQLTTLSLLGATLGDPVAVSFSRPLLSTRIWAEVTSANTVTVYHHNPTDSSVDIQSGLLRVKLL